MRAKQSWVQ